MPTATAVALMLRHSWRREELVKFAKRFGIKLTAKDLSEVAPGDNSEATVTDADATPSLGVVKSFDAFK